MSAANFLISLGQTIDRSSSQSMTIIGMTAEAERVAVEAAGEFHFPEGVYANRYHYLFKIRNSRIFAGFEYFDTSVARSEERRVGKEGVSKVRFRWARFN